MPKVSVIIATYNRAHYIQEAINSVLAQTYTDYEIIVCDDGSSDKTKEIVQTYGNKVRYFYQPNQGKSFAQNSAINQAKGIYIALLDDDDLWFPNKLEIQINILENNQQIGFVCSESYFTNKEGKIIRHWTKTSRNQENFESLYEQNFIQHSSVVIRKRFLDQVGGLDTDLITTEDYDLWLRLAKTCAFQYISMPLVKYRQHTTNKHTNTEQKLKDRIYVVSKPENIKHLNIIEKRIRIAKEYYIHAQYYQDLGNFKKAYQTYLKAVFMYPFIGNYYTQENSNKFQSLILFRIFRTYLKILNCFWRNLTLKRTF